LLQELSQQLASETAAMAGRSNRNTLKLRLIGMGLADEKSLNAGFVFDNEPHVMRKVSWGGFEHSLILVS
jgi:hypothetical protein